MIVASIWPWPVSTGVNAETRIAFPARSGPQPLSVLTYNVHGLPWPIARGRVSAMEKIADRLRALRMRGEQPSVVVLQEAFTAEAKAIGARAGYRFVVEGPSRDLRSDVRPSADDLAFAADARWSKGETLGRLYDSGLMILTDLPVTAIKRIAFPRFACAGYDCLANKGAVMVTVREESTGQPVQIVTTHLNSRHSSYVPDERSFHAYAEQMAALSAFIRRNRVASSPIIIAGDMNASSPQRRDLLAKSAAAWLPKGERPMRDALQVCVAPRASCDAQAMIARNYSRDWEFYGGGARRALGIDGISVPFGRAPNGEGLSDHIGYSATYAVRL